MRTEELRDLGLCRLSLGDAKDKFHEHFIARFDRTFVDVQEHE